MTAGGRILAEPDVDANLGMCIWRNGHTTKLDHIPLDAAVPMVVNDREQERVSVARADCKPIAIRTGSGPGIGSRTTARHMHGEPIRNACWTSSTPAGQR
jgi:nitrogen fixation protein